MAISVLHNLKMKCDLLYQKNKCNLLHQKIHFSRCKKSRFILVISVLYNMKVKCNFMHEKWPQTFCIQKMIYQ